MPIFEQESLSVTTKNFSITQEDKNKKPLRRTALEIKQAQELEEKEQSLQEKEWEIPAFLRKVKFKP